MSRALIANGQTLAQLVLPLSALNVGYIVVLTVVATRSLLGRICSVHDGVVLTLVCFRFSVFNDFKGPKIL